MTWVFDEVKDRCCGISERKMINIIKSGMSKDVLRRKRRRVKSNSNGPGGEDQEGDGYRNYETM